MGRCNRNDCGRAAEIKLRSKQEGSMAGVVVVVVLMVVQRKEVSRDE
jgi:hypothetical protein